MPPIVIDIHAHYTPAELLLERYGAEAAKFPRVKLARNGSGVSVRMAADEPPRAIMPALSNLDARRASLDANAIDHQLVCGWVEIFGYDLPAHEGLAWTRFMNGCMRDALRGE